MKKIEKILLATDFTRASEDAQKMAASLAAKSASKIYLLHVIPKAIQLYGRSLDQTPLLQESTNVLGEYADEIRRGGVSEVETLLVSGNPQEEIISQADTLGVNVIMIGSGDKDRGDRFPLGVTAQNIIRSTATPVWVVRRGSSAGIKSILCPVDFSEHSRRAVVNAADLSRMFGAKLQVLAVAENLSRVYRGMPLYLGKGEADGKRHCKKELDKFLRDFDFEGMAYNRAVRYGEPHEEVLKAASEMGADLMVMGSIGRTGLTRVLMGSVAEKIARELPCSLIMMKAQDLVEQSRTIKAKNRKAGSKFELLEKMPR
jgi:nucleotide-binding universal stress UspA family protein